MLFLRLLLAIVVASFRPKLKGWQPSVVKYRVLPTDLDVNLHMNNARYSAFMDLGRLDLLTRLGVWKPLFKNRWRVMMASVGVRFHRPLAPFERFRLESRLVGWDDKAFYGIQLFHVGDRVRASGYFRAVFTAEGKMIKTVEVKKRLRFAAFKPQQKYAKQLRAIKRELKHWADTEQSTTRRARDLTEGT